MMASYVLCSAFFSSIRELIQLSMDIKNYFLDMFNYVHLLGIGTMAATAIIALDPIEQFNFWLYPLESVRFNLDIRYLNPDKSSSTLLCMFSVISK